jgi:hypothetical protein
MSMDIITRRHYAEKIDSRLGKEVVIVLTGQRCVGKSSDFIRKLIMLSTA